jgi:ATP-independent RNA helicase DbpA
MKPDSASFSQLKISKDLIAVIQELGYDAMTPIQAESIPHLLHGKDVIGQSETGSGKTAAFSIPILQEINTRDRSIQALILCPTRELCAQVAREIRRLARRHKGLQVLVLAGGQFIAPQLSALEKGAHIAVGTPGRVLDIITRKKLDLAKLKTFVLDEADRMLDMGFEDDMLQIMKALPKQRQTVLFSATFPDSIQTISKLYQTNPVSIKIKKNETDSVAIKQYFIHVDHSNRTSHIAKILKALNPERTIIFCNLKASTRDVSQSLQDDGFKAESLSGDLEQFERDRVMAKFRNLTTKVLVATDVAARGIDIEKLDLVINFDTPAKPDVYVHRIGRTGRAGKKGVSVSLLSSKESHKLDYIDKYTGVKHQTISLEQFLEDFKKSIPDAASATSNVAMTTVCVHGGRKDKVRPGDILGALTGDAGGFLAKDIGKIEIHDRLTYVALNSLIVEDAVKSLSQGRIKGRTFKISLVT